MAIVSTETNCGEPEDFKGILTCLTQQVGFYPFVLELTCASPTNSSLDISRPQKPPTTTLARWWWWSRWWSQGQGSSLGETSHSIADRRSPDFWRFPSLSQSRPGSRWHRRERERPGREEEEDDLTLQVWTSVWSSSQPVAMAISAQHTCKWMLWKVDICWKTRRLKWIIPFLSQII